MSQKNVYKPTLVLMAGLPGTGKTTLAAELGRMLRWPILNKDLLKWSLLRSNMSQEEAGRVAYNLLFDQAEDFLVRQQLSVILDTSAHRLFILKEATRIAQSAGAEMKIIKCTASSNLRRQRLNERIDSVLHVPFMSPMETTTIENDTEPFKHLPEEVFIIETCCPFEDCLNKAIEYLDPSDKVQNQ